MRGEVEGRGKSFSQKVYARIGFGKRLTSLKERCHNKVYPKVSK
jgi:hypothetical protein